MAQRTVCLCNGKYVGIEEIYTVINGEQINIPEKLKWLRTKSQKNALFCPCGCGANLILVAGDRNLREQHFRLKDGNYEDKCHVITEGKNSVDSKIVLKCWLDEKLQISDIESRVPIRIVGNTIRKYEFTFLSREKKMALNYCNERVNLSDEKFEILEANSQNIKIIYVVDISNKGCNGQYPEALMKIQDRQGYCLFLEVTDASYNKAKMTAVFYMKDENGRWREIGLTEGQIKDYSISAEGQIYYQNRSLVALVNAQTEIFEKNIKLRQQRHEIEEKQRIEQQKKVKEEAERKREELQKQMEIAEKERIERNERIKLQREKEEAERLAERRRRADEFKKNLESNFSQQQTPVRDADGNRWIKCEFCGVIAKESEFTSYGGANHVNLGTCKSCSSKKAAQRVPITVKRKENNTEVKTINDSICPECGGKLREKSGKYGSFMGCSNYPKCKYTRRIKKI